MELQPIRDTEFQNVRASGLLGFEVQGFRMFGGWGQRGGRGLVAFCVSGYTKNSDVKLETPYPQRPKPL